MFLMFTFGRKMLLPNYRIKFVDFKSLASWSSIHIFARNVGRIVTVLVYKINANRTLYFTSEKQTSTYTCKFLSRINSISLGSIIKTKTYPFGDAKSLIVE